MAESGIINLGIAKEIYFAIVRLLCQLKDKVDSIDHHLNGQVLVNHKGRASYKTIMEQIREESVTEITAAGDELRSSLAARGYYEREIPKPNREQSLKILDQIREDRKWIMEMMEQGRERIRQVMDTGHISPQEEPQK